MRLIPLAAAGAAILAGPAAAQDYRYAPVIDEAGPAIEEIAPAMDRATEALMNIDIGPILDAVDPMRPHPHRTLRDMARRDDPDFDRNLRAQIYGSAAGLRRMTAAAAAAEPALRQALDQFRASIAVAMGEPAADLPPPPPGAPAMDPPLAAPDEPEDDWYPLEDAPPPPKIDDE